MKKSNLRSVTPEFDADELTHSNVFVDQRFPNVMIILRANEPERLFQHVRILREKGSLGKEMAVPSTFACQGAVEYMIPLGGNVGRFW